MKQVGADLDSDPSFPRAVGLVAREAVPGDPREGSSEAITVASQALGGPPTLVSDFVRTM